MPSERVRNERVNGPYKDKDRDRWRVIEVRGDGTRSVVFFTREAAAGIPGDYPNPEAEALKYIAAAKKVAIGRTVGLAVTEYLQHLKEAPAPRGGVRRDSTVELNRTRLVHFLGLPDKDRPLGAVTVQYARQLFEARAAKVKPDTLIAELAAVGRLVKYCCQEGWLRANPFATCQVVGDLSAGKPQLREDEARRFMRVALDEGSQGGLAAALALLTGMRASEITGLVVRDLDSSGTVLWVADNAVRRLKTRKQRRLAVPTEELSWRLLQLCYGKAPEARLFTDDGCKDGVHRYWLYNHVERLCVKAGVPRVSPHGLRGTFATLAREVMDTKKVADALGNLPRVSATNYIQAGAAESADAARLAQTLGGHDATDHRGSDSGPRGSRDHEAERGVRHSDVPPTGVSRQLLEPGADGDPVGTQCQDRVVDTRDGQDWAPWLN